MVIRGRIEHGVVVFEERVSLPEGADVTVFVRAESNNGKNVMPEQRNKRAVAMAKIAAVPDENPGDTFSGADHDKALYG